MGRIEVPKIKSLLLIFTTLILLNNNYTSYFIISSLYKLVCTYALYMVIEFFNFAINDIGSIQTDHVELPVNDRRGHAMHVELQRPMWVDYVWTIKNEMRGL